MKKLIAILTVFAMLFSFAACNKDTGNTDPTNEFVTDNSGETVTNEQGENVTVSNTEESSETTDATTAVTDTTAATTPLTDPSTCSKEEIVEFYKNAAINSKSQKSVQKMTLSEIVVNDGDGVLGKFVEWITPIFISALEDNSTEFDGITGGYEKLLPDDAQSAKAYKSGDYVVVEMTMKEQVDGAHGDLHSGTVGHAISVVGDLAVVQEALPQFIVDFENADVKLHYKNPKLKVKINKDGVIEKGTWSYDVYITIANLNIAAVDFPIEVLVESGYGSVDYLITVGGGF